MHPTFHPRAYVDFRVSLPAPDRARIEFHDSPAFAESDDYSWFAGLRPEGHPALDAIAQVINPRARLVPVVPENGARLVWDIVVDAGADPVKPPRSLGLGQISKGASFQFERRRLPRV